VRDWKPGSLEVERGRAGCGRDEVVVRSFSKEVKLSRVPRGDNCLKIITPTTSCSRALTNPATVPELSAQLSLLLLLQNITNVINPRGATVFPKGHTSWDTPLHLYIIVMICGIQTVLSFCLSLNLVTTEYTSTRYQPRCFPPSQKRP
jgi:hypothetical protein